MFLSDVTSPNLTSFSHLEFSVPLMLLFFKRKLHFNDLKCQQFYTQYNSIDTLIYFQQKAKLANKRILSTTILLDQQLKRNQVLWRVYSHIFLSNPHNVHTKEWHQMEQAHQRGTNICLAFHSDSLGSNHLVFFICVLLFSLTSIPVITTVVSENYIAWNQTDSTLNI